MEGESKIAEFFQDISSNIDNLDFCIKLCKANRDSDNPELSVIATSLLEIFEEMKRYFDYFNSEIAKKFGFRGTKEWRRIKAKVLEYFSKDVKKKDLTVMRTRLEVVNNLIKRWSNLPKETEADIIGRARAKSDSNNK
ncbi:hypothetical protein KGY79_10615 [Candidatus Bipolaricaulota bacterium]|nr:hypothetical protein [Candidatus Bipolaricaulota bacterium]